MGTQVLNMFSTNACTTKTIIVESLHKMGFMMISRYEMIITEASLVFEHLFYFYEHRIRWVVTMSVFISNYNDEHVNSLNKRLKRLSSSSYTS